MKKNIFIITLMLLMAAGLSAQDTLNITSDGIVQVDGDLTVTGQIVAENAIINQFYDISSSNQTYALPDAAAFSGEITIFWNNGGAGWTMNFTTVDGQTINEDVVADWKGEGDGRIVLVSDGAQWRVKDYMDSGSNSNGEWRKLMDGTQICRINNFPIVYVNSPSIIKGVWSFPKGFTNIEYTTLVMENYHFQDSMDYNSTVRKDGYFFQEAKTVDVISICYHSLSVTFDSSYNVYTDLYAEGRWK